MNQKQPAQTEPKTAAERMKGPRKELPLVPPKPAPLSRLYFVHRPPSWYDVELGPCESFARAIEAASGQECVELCEEFFTSNAFHLLRSSTGDPLTEDQRRVLDYEELRNVAKNAAATFEFCSLRQNCAHLEDQVLQRLKQQAINGFVPSFASQYGYVEESPIPIRYDLGLIKLFGTGYLQHHVDARRLFYAAILNLLDSTPQEFFERSGFEDGLRGKGQYPQQYAFVYEVKRFIDAQVKFFKDTQSLVFTARSPVAERIEPTELPFRGKWIELSSLREEVEHLLEDRILTVLRIEGDLHWVWASDADSGLGLYLKNRIETKRMNRLGLAAEVSNCLRFEARMAQRPEPWIKQPKIISKAIDNAVRSNANEKIRRFLQNHP